MSKIIDIPIIERLFAGSDGNGGIKKFRNVETASWGRVFVTEVMLVGTCLVALIEVVTRFALTALAFIPMMFTQENQLNWESHFATPMCVTFIEAVTLPILMIDNVVAKCRKDTEMGKFLGNIFKRDEYSYY